jgi:hypothetical protein
MKVSSKGVGKLKIKCKRTKKCNGRVTVKAKGVTSAAKVSISGKKTKSVKMRFSKSEVKRIRKAGRLGSNSSLKIGNGDPKKGRVTLIGPKKKKH